MLYFNCVHEIKDDICVSEKLGIYLCNPKKTDIEWLEEKYRNDDTFKCINQEMVVLERLKHIVQIQIKDPGFIAIEGAHTLSFLKKDLDYKASMKYAEALQEYKKIMYLMLVNIYSLDFQYVKIIDGKNAPDSFNDMELLFHLLILPEDKAEEQTQKVIYFIESLVAQGKILDKNLDQNCPIFDKKTLTFIGHFLYRSATMPDDLSYFISLFIVIEKLIISERKGGLEAQLKLKVPVIFKTGRNLREFSSFSELKDLFYSDELPNILEMLYDIRSRIVHGNNFDFNKIIKKHKKLLKRPELAFITHEDYLKHFRELLQYITVYVVYVWFNSPHGVLNIKEMTLPEPTKTSVRYLLRNILKNIFPFMYKNKSI